MARAALLALLFACVAVLSVNAGSGKNYYDVRSPMSSSRFTVSSPTLR